MVNKLISTVLLGLVLWIFLLFGVGHNPSMAVTLTSVGSGFEKSVQPPDEILNG
jgi:hypothetical protein